MGSEGLRLYPELVSDIECQDLILYVSTMSLEPVKSAVPRLGLRGEFQMPSLSDQVGQALGGMVSSRWLAYKYPEGGFISPHYDGPYRQAMKKSRRAVLLYLNSDFQGGNTLFYLPSGPKLVRPEEGLVVTFGYDLLHEGLEVLAGTKWMLRADLF